MRISPATLYRYFPQSHGKKLRASKIFAEPHCLSKPPGEVVHDKVTCPN